MNDKSLAKNAVFNIIYKVANIIFPLITTAYVSRIMLSDGVGRLSAVGTNSNYFIILAMLGIPAYGLREVSKNRDNREKLNALFSELFTINMVLTAASLILYYVSLRFIPYFENDYKLYLVYSISIMLNVINIDWFFQGIEEYKYIVRNSLIIKVILLIAILLFINDNDDIYLLAIITILGTAGYYLINIIQLRRFVSITFSKLNLKRHLKPLVFLALCYVSTELYAKMDITMLDVMQGSSVVGYYASAQKIINLVVVTLTSITAVFLPRLSFVYEKNREDFNKFLKIGLELMILLSIPTFVGMIVVARPMILTLFGNDFISSIYIAQILSLMIPLKCIGDIICYQVMMCAGKESLLMKAYFATMIINIINNIILIPRYGAVGASIASVFSEIFVFAFVYCYSRKYVSISGIFRVLIKTVIATAVMVIFVLCCDFLHLPLYAELLFKVVIGVVTFFIISILIKNEVLMRYVRTKKIET